MEENTPFELLTLWGEAREHTERRRFDRAIEIYKYILLMYAEDKTACQHAHAYLGDVYLTSREIDLATEHVRKALRYDPHKPEYHYLLGFIYSHQSQWKRSIKEFGIALSAVPENAEYLRGLGWSTYNSGDREQGILILNKALRIQPDNVNILTDLAVSYLGIADFRLARKYVKTALKLDPGNSSARGTLWMIDYAEHQAHMEED